MSASFVSAKLHMGRLLLTTVCPLALFAVPAHAQSANPGMESQADQGDARDGNGEIVVTALKRSQALTAVPASISALDEKALAMRGITNLGDLQQQTPSLSFGSSLGTNQVSIRGVGLTIATGAGEPGVAVHLDGVYEARPALSGLAQFDLQRVEILRGPQGTLYGRNATGGAINFISNPATSTFEGKAKLGYAEYNELHGELVASGPVSEGIRARFGVTYTNRADGFVENIRPDQDDSDKAENIGARGKLSFDLSPAAVLDVQMSYLHSTGSQVYFNPVEAPLNPAAVAANPTLQTAQYVFGATRTAVDSSTLDRTAYQPVATLSWDLGGASLKSISAYTDIESASVNDSDGTSAKLAVLPNSYKSKQFTQELNLSGSAGNLDWLIGGFYLHENYRASQDVFFVEGFNVGVPDGAGGFLVFPVFPAGAQLVQHYSEKRSSYAGFIDGTYHLTDRLSVFAGARYSEDRVTLTQTNGILPFGLSCNNLVTPAKFTAFTPRGGVQFEPNDGGNLYGSVSRGYKAGGLNFGTCGNTYEPETLTAYEVGYKTRLLNNTITLGISAYYYDYKDLQVYQLKPITEGSGSTIGNAPKATVKGIEGDFAWSPSSNFQFNASGAYLDAVYDTYFNAESRHPELGLRDLSGKRITRSPKFTGNAGIQYTTPDIGEAGRIILRGEVYHSSKQFFSEFNRDEASQKAYTTFNAFVTLESADKKYNLRLYARNLTNVHYLNFTTDSPLSGTTLGTFSPPRQIGGELTVNF